MRGEDGKLAGLFEPLNEGTAAMPLEGSLKGFDAVAVSLEPTGGSPAPTSDVLLTANLHAASPIWYATG